MQGVSMDPAKARLLQAALTHVPFEGWTAAAFEAAAADAGMSVAEARAVCPRGVVDLARAYHLQGDAALLAAVEAEDLSGLRYSEKVARAVWLRIAATPDKEVVRRGTVLFAQPHLVVDGAQLIWGTADAIWEALGDTSEDVNWYSKRAILSGVIGSTVLFWLGDDSAEHGATRDFLDRRIEDVMRFEKIKADIRANPLLSRIVTPLERIGGQIRRPARVPKVDLPGRWTR